MAYPHVSLARFFCGELTLVSIHVDVALGAAIFEGLHTHAARGAAIALTGEQAQGEEAEADGEGVFHGVMTVQKRRPLGRPSFVGVF